MSCTVRSDYGRLTINPVSPKAGQLHRFTTRVVHSQAHYAKAGRPKAGDEPDKLTYSFEAEFEQLPSLFEEAEGSQGLYLIATNELNAELYPAERVIKTYKAQGVTVERGFRFLKDPMFFADSLFLKKPSRLMSLMMVMTLSLLVVQRRRVFAS